MLNILCRGQSRGRECYVCHSLCEPLTYLVFLLLPFDGAIEFITSAAAAVEDGAAVSVVMDMDFYLLLLLLSTSSIAPN